MIIRVTRHHTTPYVPEETFEYKGRTFAVALEPDEEQAPPWEDGDGRGIVSEWVTRAKRPGERVLHHDRRSYRYYDMQATMAKARAEGWPVSGHGDKTARQRAALAVEADFEHMRRWCNDQWHYVSLVVTLLEGNDDDGWTEGPGASLWGLESDDYDHHEEMREQLADEALSQAS